jgi:hypothetical protein
MEKATVSSITYVPSDSIEMQGKRKNIDKYLNAGYYIKENRNGYWVLVKTAQVEVALANGSFARVFNIKDDICDHYGKTRISESLVDRFRNDILNGAVTIFLDSQGNYALK